MIKYYFRTAVLLFCLGCSQPEVRQQPVETWQTSPYGPTPATRVNRNLKQTGVHDQQIPLEIRIRFADQNGIARPSR